MESAIKTAPNCTATIERCAFLNFDAALDAGDGSTIKIYDTAAVNTGTVVRGKNITIDARRIYHENGIPLNQSLLARIIRAHCHGYV